MEKYNFDEEICRRGTSCIKFDALKNSFGKDDEDIIPLWVADMDFRTPPFIMEAIRNRCRHEILGYAYAPDEYYETIAGWIKKRHDWSVRREWIGFVPGIVPGLAHCIKAFTSPGDRILIQPPVYPPFHHLIENNGRQLVFNPLKLEDGQFSMDFQDLESQLKSGCKMMILCNPHNPGGRVWNLQELKTLAKLCARYDTIVVSDEIHADLALPGYKHVPFGVVSGNSISLMAPSKTFNMAGLGSSYYIIPDDTIRARFNDFLSASELNNGHLFAFCTTQVAYERGEEWLSQVCEYIAGNIRFVDDYLKHHIPAIKAVVPQASFLVWLDCRQLGLQPDELGNFFLNEARLALNNGETFGKEGRGFMRLNVGTTRALLKKALERLAAAVNRLHPEKR